MNKTYQKSAEECQASDLAAIMVDEGVSRQEAEKVLGYPDGSVTCSDVQIARWMQVYQQ